MNLDPLLTTPLGHAFRGRHVVQVIHQLDPVLAIDFLADKGLLQNYADALLVGHAHSRAPVESSSTAPLTGAELSALTRESGGLNCAYHERRDKNGAPDSGGSARTDRSDGRAGTTTRRALTMRMITTQPALLTGSVGVTIRRTRTTKMAPARIVTNVR